MKKTGNAIRWIFGFLMILGATGMFDNSIPQAITALLFGVSLLPLTWKIIGKNLKFWKKLLPVFVPIVFLIAYMTVSPSPPAQSTLSSVHTTDPAEADNQAESQTGGWTEPQTNGTVLNETEPLTSAPVPAETESQPKTATTEGNQQTETVTEPESAIQPESSNDLTLDVIDVGQGLALLLESDGHYLLYDGGGKDYSSKTVAFLKQREVEHLDYIIASHYDDDHLNGIVGALNVFDTGMVFAPDYIADTEIFEVFQRTLSEKGLSATHPVAGQQYPLGNSSFSVLAPVQADYTDENDYSIVIRVACGDTSVLITGDATSVSEAEIIAGGQTADSDILIVGHHGSASSTSQAFLDYVSPNVAVINCKLDNPYQHPSQEVMQRLETAHIPVFRTDMQGDFRLSTDGTAWNYSADPCNDYSYNTEPSLSTEDTEQSSEDMYTTATLNIRNAATTDSDILGKLSAGEKVEVLRVNGDWATIIYSGGTAYVAASYLSKAAPEADSTSNGTGHNSNFNTYDNPEQQQTSAQYVLNNNTMKFHKPSCKSVKKIAPHNYGTSNESRDSLIAQGYSPCGNCHP